MVSLFYSLYSISIYPTLYHNYIKEKRIVNSFKRDIFLVDTYSKLGDNMNWKIFAKNMGYAYLTLFLGTFLFTILSFFHLCNGRGIAIAEMIVLLLSLSFSYQQGKKGSKKGILEGFLFGSCLAFSLFLLNFIFFKDFALKNLLYYGIILFLSTLGGMLGVHRRKEKSS